MTNPPTHHPRESPKAKFCVQNGLALQLFAIVFVLCLSGSCYSQQYTAIYALVESDEVNSGALKDFDAQFASDHPTASFEEAFPSAKSEILQRIRRYTSPVISDYSVISSYLQQSPIFEFIDLEELVLSEHPSGNINPVISHESTLEFPYPPACETPYIYNDPGSVATEHLETNQISCAWNLSQGDPNIVIGIVDIGFNRSHPDLANKSATNILNDQAGSGTDHGTAVAGAAVAIVNNNSCVAGSGFNCRYDGRATGSDILKSVWDLYLAGRPIINLSIHSRSWESLNPVPRAVFEEITAGGTTVTFAANQKNSFNFDGIDGMIIVGMAYSNGWFTNYPNRPPENGPDRNLDVIVASRNISRLQSVDDCSVGPGNTSIAAPMTAGVVGLMLSENPCLSPQEIEEIIKETSFPLRPDNAELTQGQLRGKGHLNAYAAVEAAINIERVPELVVNYGQDILIQNGVKTYRRIKVKTGGVLRIYDSRIDIKGEFFQGYNLGQIIVERGAKLIAANTKFKAGNVNNCSSVPQGWVGIRVHGNVHKEQPDMYNSNGILEVNTQTELDDAGVIMLLPGTEIRGADYGVRIDAPGLGWPAQRDHWGGLVIADGVKFINNKRAAHFPQYPLRGSGNTFTDKSSFNNCYFVTSNPELSNAIGITAWDVDGITVTNSTFKNFGRESISTLDGSYSIAYGNTFITDDDISKNHRHVYSVASYPYAGDMIVGTSDDQLPRNDFRSNNNRDIFVAGESNSSLGGLRVYNNDFRYTGVSIPMSPAVEITGPTKFDILGNYFEKSYPLFTDQTGIRLFNRNNLVRCNYFESSSSGIIFKGNNNGLEILKNQFAGITSTNRSITINGSIDIFQGSASRPANNRFETLSSNISFRDIFVTSASVSFDYYYTNGSQFPNPYEPRGNQFRFSAISTNSQIPFTCIVSAIGLPPTQSDVLSAQNDYEVAMNNSGTSGSASLLDIKLKEKKRDSLLNLYVEEGIRLQDLVSVATLLNQIQEEKSAFRLYGAAVQLRDLGTAQTVLSQLSAIPALSEFVSIQEINLDRIAATNSSTEYSLPSADSSFLSSVATSSSKFRGYARAILLQQKNLVYYDDYSAPLVSVARKRVETTQFEDVRSFKVSPNPVRTEFIEITGINPDFIGDIIISDVFGRVLDNLRIQHSSNLTIPAPKMNGIYFITLKGGIVDETFKIIVSR